MALRVARGLFRLWLVLSVLWIGGVGVVTWWTLPEARPSMDEIYDAVPGKTPSLEEISEQRKARRRTAIQFASIEALVPPAFVLALGSALVWAFRGFR
jgi:hypothetical protein